MSGFTAVQLRAVSSDTFGGRGECGEDGGGDHHRLWWFIDRTLFRVVAMSSNVLLLPFHLMHALQSLCSAQRGVCVMFIVFLHTWAYHKTRNILFPGSLWVACGESFQVAVSLVVLQSFSG